MVEVLQVLEDLTQVFMVVVVPILELVARHFQIEYYLPAAAAAAEMVVQVGLAIQVAQEAEQLVVLVQDVVDLQWRVEQLPQLVVLLDMIVEVADSAELQEL